MPSLDARIDELYAGPLAGFTAARNALAKTLAGDEAARVKALAKPTVAAWAVNQVYWHARDTFDGVVDTGERVRKAQIAALQGKPVDLRAATSAHREAVGAAVKEAERLAAAAGSHPSPDALTRTLEALSLAPRPPAPFGRLTEELRPAGFEALAGISPVAAHRPAPQHGRPSTESHAAKAGAPPQALSAKAESAREAEARRAAVAAEAARAKAAAAEVRKREAAIAKAEAALARAQGAERMAHDAWLRAQQEVDEARQRLTRAKST